MAEVGTHQRRGGPRGKVTGWSPGAARRNVAFLRSVEVEHLDGLGLAATLTVKHCPASPQVWADLVRAWVMRQRRAGMRRLHWVMEFQRRGVPHLHAAIWFDPDQVKSFLPGEVAPSLHPDLHRETTQHVHAAAKLVADWIDISSSGLAASVDGSGADGSVAGGGAAEAPPTRPGLGAGPKGQQVRPLVGDVGWFMYLAKHCGRGRQHYQRQMDAMPDAWESSPRVWGKSGEWHLVDPADVNVTAREWFQLRRLVRAQRVAAARQDMNLGWSWADGGLLTRPQLRDLVLRKGKRPYRVRLRNLQHARRMLRCPDAKLSAVRGISEWVTEDRQADLLRALRST
jgi:hypothetical protein